MQVLDMGLVLHTCRPETPGVRLHASSLLAHMLPTAHRLGTMLWCGAQIKFYPGRYAAEKCSILPVGDPTQYIPDNEVRRFAVTKRFLLL